MASNTITVIFLSQTNRPKMPFIFIDECYRKGRTPTHCTHSIQKRHQWNAHLPCTPFDILNEACKKTHKHTHAHIHVQWHSIGLCLSHKSSSVKYLLHNKWIRQHLTINSLKCKPNDGTLLNDHNWIDDECAENVTATKARGASFRRNVRRCFEPLKRLDQNIMIRKLKPKWNAIKMILLKFNINFAMLNVRWWELSSSCHPANVISHKMFTFIWKSFAHFAYNNFMFEPSMKIKIKLSL